VPRISDDRAQVSSLVLVDRIEQTQPPAADASPAPNAGNTADDSGDAGGGPLYVGNLLVYPNAGEPISKRDRRELTFYFSIYSNGPGRVQAPSAELELLASGRLLARVPLKLTEPDARQRIQQVSRMPIDTLTPGAYELRLRVHDGRRIVERAAFLRLIE
jgi:hypothetical protein